MAGSGKKAAQASTSSARDKIVKRRQLSRLPVLPPHYRAQRSPVCQVNLAERWARLKQQCCPFEWMLIGMADGPYCSDDHGLVK